MNVVYVEFNRGMDPNSLNIVLQDIDRDKLDVGFVQCYPGHQPKIVFWDSVVGVDVPAAIMKKIVEQGEEMHRALIEAK